jgi:hypothetical protein
MLLMKIFLLLGYVPLRTINLFFFPVSISMRNSKRTLKMVFRFHKKCITIQNKCKQYRVNVQIRHYTLVAFSICSRNVLNVCLYFCSIRLQGKIIPNKITPLSCVLLETAHRRSTGKEISRLLYNQKIHYRAQKSSQLGYVQRQTSSTLQSIPLSKRTISGVVLCFVLRLFHFRLQRRIVQC